MRVMMSLTGWVRAVCAVAVVMGLCTNLARGDAEFKSLVMEGDHLPGLKEGFKVVSVSYVDTSTNGTIALRALATADGTDRDGVETVAGLWVVLPGGEPQLIGRSEYKSNPLRGVKWLSSSHAIVNDNGTVLMFDSDICRGYMTAEAQRNLKNKSIVLYRPGAAPKVLAKTFDVRGGVQRVVRMGYFTPIDLLDSGEALFTSTAASAGTPERPAPGERSNEYGGIEAAHTLWYADRNGNAAIVLDLNTQDAGRAAKNYVTGTGRAAFADDGTIVVTGEVRESYKDRGTHGLFRLVRGKDVEWILRLREPVGPKLEGILLYAHLPTYGSGGLFTLKTVKDLESLPTPRDIGYGRFYKIGCWTAAEGVRAFQFSERDMPTHAHAELATTDLLRRNKKNEVVVSQSYRWHENTPKEAMKDGIARAIVVISPDKPARILMRSFGILQVEGGHKLEVVRQQHEARVLSFNDRGTVLMCVRELTQKEKPPKPMVNLVFRAGKPPAALVINANEIALDGKPRKLKDYGLGMSMGLLPDDRVLINASFEDGGNGVIIGTLKNP